MGLTEIERKEIVKYRLENAKTTFAEISILLENKLYKTAANRLYYSCYYAATALLINDGREAHTHVGVKTLLSLHFISTNLIDKSFSYVLWLNPTRVAFLRNAVDMWWHHFSTERCIPTECD